MRQALTVILTVAAIVATVSPATRAPVVVAQEATDPPELGASILEDPLAATGAMRATACPTGRNAGEFVPDGFRVKVTGRCVAEHTTAFLRLAVPGLVMRDGEASVEAAAMEGSDRVRISLFARQQANGDGYSLSWEPGLGVAALRKSAGETGILLAERTGVPRGESGGSTRLSLRLSGDRLWGFVNDELLVTATDAAFSEGVVALAVGRRGTPDEDAPTTVTWRNLRVAGLAEGDAARQPTYEPPASGPRPAAFVPPAGVPPAVGGVVMEESLATSGTFPSFTCPTGRGGGEQGGEGYTLRLRGRCIETLSTAFVAPPVSGLIIADGEMSVDFKVTAGFERTVVALNVRAQGDPNGLPTGVYAFVLMPAQGVAMVLKAGTAQGPTVLAQRRDVGTLVRRDEWNSVSVRLIGSGLWLLVNEQPVLAAEDGTYTAGRAGIQVERSGNANDEDEVAVVLRNLRVSAIEGAPDDRAPVYERPQPASDEAAAHDRLPLGLSHPVNLVRYP